MLIQNDKNRLDHAVKLAKAVRMVTDALTTNFREWKKNSHFNNNFVDKEVIKNMEKTHQLVLDYIYGLLGGKMDEVVDQVLKGKEP